MTQRYRNIRSELNRLGFNWDEGQIIMDHAYVDHIGVVLDRDHDVKYGYEFPAFIAKDDKRIYFPVMFEGSAWVESILIDFEEYLDDKNPMPYPGCG